MRVLRSLACEHEGDPRLDLRERLPERHALRCASFALRLKLLTQVFPALADDRESLSQLRAAQSGAERNVPQRGIAPFIEKFDPAIHQRVERSSGFGRDDN